MVLLLGFDHLNSFSYPVENVLVRFSYSNHVFTSGRLTPPTPAHLFIDNRGNRRTFDNHRHQDSILLSQHLRNLTKHKIYNESHGNAFYYPTALAIYQIIISMKREKKGIAVHVESAYRLDAPPKLKHESSMRFPVAVKHVYKGKPIFPRR